jgi:hypothetical protein
MLEIKFWSLNFNTVKGPTVAADANAPVCDGSPLAAPRTARRNAVRSADIPQVVKLKKKFFEFAHRHGRHAPPCMA